MRTLYREYRDTHSEGPFEASDVEDATSSSIHDPSAHDPSMDDGDYIMSSPRQGMSISDDSPMSNASRSPIFTVGTYRGVSHEAPTTTPCTEMILREMRDMEVRFQTEMGSMNVKLDFILNETSALRAQIDAISGENHCLVDENRRLADDKQRLADTNQRLADTNRRLAEENGRLSSDN